MHGDAALLEAALHDVPALGRLLDATVADDGLVEIGYSIAPALRGRGLATAAARLLVEQSLADPRVNVVQAHTLAMPNASTRVLEKMGFQRVAELIDPKEHPDPIWRWQLRRHYT